MIYFICRNVGEYGGAAVVAMDIIESLNSTDHKIRIVNRNLQIPQRLIDDFKKNDWIDMPFFPQKETYKGSRFGNIKYLFRSLQSEFETIKLKKHVNNDSPGLMLFNTLTCPEQQVFNLFKNEFKTAQIVHLSPKYLQEFDNVLSMEAALEIFGSSDALIFVSDECRKEWLSFEELHNKRSFYIPNCANEFMAKKLLANQKADIRKELNMEPGNFHLVSVASFQPHKGQDLLVKAAPQLKKIAPNLEILFVGRDSGDYCNRLKKECENKGFNFVKFLGRKSNAMEYIFASDAFILTSRTEAFPLVILEAMILKTPVMASNINGVPEMIEDRENGYLFESDNVENMITAFESMYNNKEQRKVFVEKSSQKYWDNFSKKHFVNRYKNVIEKMTE